MVGLTSRLCIVVPKNNEITFALAPPPTAKQMWSIPWTVTPEIWKNAPYVIQEVGQQEMSFNHLGLSKGLNC